MLHQIILLFHGSRVPETLTEASHLVELLRSGAGNPEVRCAFLQNSSPALPDSLDEAASAGFRKLTIFPLFALTGKHVREDIPELIATFQARHPDIQVRLRPHLGGDPDFQSWLSDKVGRIFQDPDGMI